MAVPSFDQRDVAQHKTLGGLGYLIPFVPLIACADSKFGKYCANQGLLFWLAIIAVRFVFWIIGIVFGWVPFLGGLFDLIGNIASLAVVALEIYYTVIAMTKGTAKEVPFVGNIQLIK